MPRLENWFSKEEPLNVFRITGDVYDREGYTNGERVHTNTLAGVEGDSTVVTSSGTKYILGEIHPDWNHVPNLKANLFNALAQPASAPVEAAPAPAAPVLRLAPHTPAGSVRVSIPGVTPPEA